MTVGIVFNMKKGQVDQPELVDSVYVLIVYYKFPFPEECIAFGW